MTDIVAQPVYADTGYVTKAQLNQVGQALYGEPANLMLTADLTARVIRENLKGDLVECGVGAGAHPAIMALSLGKAFVSSLRDLRRVYLVDSFRGIPKGGPKDHSDITDLVGVAAGEAIEESGETIVSEDGVRENMKQWGVDAAWTYYRKGWFQDSLPRLAHEIGIKREGDWVSGGISLLRIDGDLYESVRCCLENLWRHVVLGGFVILDDYSLKGARAAIDEFHARINFGPVYNPIGSGTAVWYQKPRD